MSQDRNSLVLVPIGIREKTGPKNTCLRYLDIWSDKNTEENYIIP